jgi:CHASE2 domain-containing sensor protein
MYEVWKRARQPGRWYQILRGIGNSYWIVVWTLILVAVCHHWRSRLATDYITGTLILTCLYFLAIHSVFESADKYHDPLVGILAVLASLAGANGRDHWASAGTAEA